VGNDKLFFGTLILVTALPLVGFPAVFAAGLGRSPELTAMLAIAVNTVSIGHVASTSFVYLDGEFGPVIKRSPWRFVVALGLVPIGCVALFILAPALSAFGVAAFIAWNLWHYQRQNYGLLAFAAASTGFDRLPPAANRMLNLAAGAAIAAVLSVSAMPPFMAHWPVLTDQMRTGLWIIGWLFYGAALVDFAILLADGRIRANRRVLIFLSLGFAFFLPAMLVGGPLLIFWPFALAHGLQYFVMGGISAGRSRWSAGVCLWALTTIAMTMVFVWLLGAVILWPVYIGLTIFDFLIDARIWKLREEPQRSIIKRRFDFVFGKPVPERASFPVLAAAE